MFQNLSIKTRLYALVAFLSVQLIAGAVIGIVSLGNANDEMRAMYNSRIVTLGQLDTIVRMVDRNETAVGVAVLGTAQDMAKAATEIDGNIETISKQWSAYAATRLTAEEKRLADAFAERRKAFVTQGLSAAVTALHAGDARTATEALRGPMTTLLKPMRESLEQLVKLQMDVAAEQYRRSQQTYIWVRNVCIAGMSAGIVLALLFGAWIVRGIVQPIQAAVKVADSVAAGDLTRVISVRSRDETGHLMGALKHMNDNLAHIVGKVRKGSDVIASASSQVASGSQDLSSRTEQQASSLEETASSLEELTSTVKQNADNARQANGLAASASEIAVKSGAVVDRVVETMESIDVASRRIADITSVIDGIAFQTNILALNAAVEAARAGEQGRGFAVVAAEVRSLAQRSAAAAKEIKSLIEDSVGKVDTGSRLAHEAGATMHEVVASVQKVTDIIAEITAASNEQSAGIEQVNGAVVQMDAATQQNAALVEEAAAAAEAMQREAAELVQAVAVFKIDVQAGSHAPTTTGTPAPLMKSVPDVTPRRNPTPASASTALARLPGAQQHNGPDWEEF
ncbi:methyl-accepting chemotaxis protein [Noviherbaspirillum pedocola]|uniref:Tar ligand binding domain-containing protein n=1 Tax=Noviherbaspirillum pedocola TaxID=2801341 RepID=A0A934SQY1_9BURK|nr:methyl-accepting chemotaxis protein [Noviherbaspirillum pedocola]MBK4734955.1 Tar ligand binding domain-containing protein [Noviherbaspirillum pedocola]